MQTSHLQALKGRQQCEAGGVNPCRKKTADKKNTSDDFNQRKNLDCFVPRNDSKKKTGPPMGSPVVHKV